MLEDGVTQPPSLPLDRAVMIAWKRECYRSSATARTFGAKLCLIPGTEGKKPVAKGLAYIVSTFKTLALLMHEKPKIILCLNQPPFLPIACTVYSLFTRTSVVMDFHSGPFSLKTWRAFLPVYNWMVKRAPFTICHNRQDGARITAWGGQVIHLLALPQAEFAGHSYAPRKERPFFLFSCSFASDEPVDLALEAMAMCPEYDFLVSGNYRKRGIDPSALPANVRLGGFMNYDDYLEAMAEATALVTFSTRSHIMQMAVHEALTMGVPVVTNESPVLREVLGDGGVFTHLDVNAIAAALHLAATDHEALASSVKEAKIDVFDSISEELNDIKNRKPHLFET